MNQRSKGDRKGAGFKTGGLLTLGGCSYIGKLQSHLWPGPLQDVWPVNGEAWNWARRYSRSRTQAGGLCGLGQPVFGLWGGLSCRRLFLIPAPLSPPGNAFPGLCRNSFRDRCNRFWLFRRPGPLPQLTSSFPTAETRPASFLRVNLRRDQADESILLDR
jgi:hypothetical protein